MVQLLTHDLSQVVEMLVAILMVLLVAEGLLTEVCFDAVVFIFFLCLC